MTSLDLMKTFWPDSSDDQVYKRFLGYIRSSLNTFGPNAKSPKTTVAVDDICKMLTQMSSLQSIDQIPGTDIILHLQGLDPDSWQNIGNDDLMIRSIAFCFSLRLSLHIEPTTTLDNTTRLSPTGALRWHSSEAISSVLLDSFPPANTPLEHDEVIEQKLTLEYLAKYYGFKIIFVDNLAQHLQIRDKGYHTVLRIYEHKIFLWNELRSDSDSILPTSLAAEALDTLNLLLPWDEDETREFLRHWSREDFHKFGPCGRHRRGNLSEYNYFRDHLARLCAVIKNKPPSPIQQLMPGRRGSNLRESLNFWIAAFVGLLTIFSIAFGITALVYAKWAYDVALLQYQLSLAQACVESDAAEMLPAFC